MLLEGGGRSGNLQRNDIRSGGQCAFTLLLVCDRKDAELHRSDLLGTQR
jgi:hypothetical protein